MKIVSKPKNPKGRPIHDGDQEEREAEEYRPEVIESLLPGQLPNDNVDLDRDRAGIMKKYCLSSGVQIPLSQVDVQTVAGSHERFGVPLAMVRNFNDSRNSDFGKQFLQEREWSRQFPGVVCLAYSAKAAEMKRKFGNDVEGYKAWVVSPEALATERFYVIDGAHRTYLAKELNFLVGHFLILDYTTPQAYRVTVACSSNNIGSKLHKVTWCRTSSQWACTIQQ